MTIPLTSSVRPSSVGWKALRCASAAGYTYNTPENYPSGRVSAYYPMAANQAGFYTCVGGQQLAVTFCPAG
jgi:hypothetical protein